MGEFGGMEDGIGDLWWDVIWICKKILVVVCIIIGGNVIFCRWDW